MFCRCGKLLILTLFLLNVAACSHSTDSQISDGLLEAGAIFKEKPKNSTVSTERLQFYLPNGYRVKNSSDESNVILSKKAETYALFFNPNESQKSQHFYKALQKSGKGELIQEKTYQKNGRFGFATVLKKDKQNYEVIASTGGVKVTGLVKKDEITHTIADLMTIAQSVQVKNK
jgi:hypothetical protein